jgi:leader peptidase (prepilin peptidase)/N-methyltransferase
VTPDPVAEQLLNAAFRWLIVGAALYGMVVGSFLNVVILRLPAGRSIVRPRSACPECGNAIAWYDNIPVLSWVLLRGRCRRCKTGISPRYALIEAATGLVAVLVLLRFVPGPGAIGAWPIVVAALYFAFCAAMICVIFIDLDHFIIPNWISLPGIPLGIVATVIAAALGEGFITPMGSIFGALLGVGIIWLVRIVAGAVMKREAMGFGDVKLMGTIGAWLGAWPGVPLVLLLSSAVGAVVSVAWAVATGKQLRGLEVPYGVWLGAAAIVALLWGELLLNAYVGLLVDLSQR